MRYAAVFEQTPTGWSAYVPDLPGCIGTGTTREEVEKNLREAVAFHLAGMKEEGLSIPAPTTWTELVEGPV